MHNVGSERCRCPTSPNSVPATNRQCHASAPSNAKPFLHWPKDCACHEEGLHHKSSPHMKRELTMHRVTNLDAHRHQIQGLPRKIDCAKFRRHLLNADETSFIAPAGPKNEPLLSIIHEIIIPQPASRPRYLFALTTRLVFSKQHFALRLCVQVHRILSLPAKLTLQAHPIQRLPKLNQTFARKNKTSKTDKTHSEKRIQKGKKYEQITNFWLFFWVGGQCFAEQAKNVFSILRTRYLSHFTLNVANFASLFDGTFSCNDAGPEAWLSSLYCWPEDVAGWLIWSAKESNPKRLCSCMQPDARVLVFADVVLSNFHFLGNPGILEVASFVQSSRALAFFLDLQWFFLRIEELEKQTLRPFTACAPHQEEQCPNRRRIPWLSTRFWSYNNC